MLAGIDRIAAALSWIAAAVLVVMLFVGPQVIAEDEPKPQDEAVGSAPYATGGGEGAEDGKQLFSDRCGSCHALEAAGTTGQVGPALDGTSLGTADVEAVIREGRGGMPSFAKQLSSAEIAAVAAFVADSR